MARPKIKVCGMRDHDNLQDVVHLYPDFVGFIFYAKSPRFVGEDFAMPLTPGINRVGVFVNRAEDEMINLAKQYDLRFVQLHGDETAHACKSLRSSGLQVIKVIQVENEKDVLKANAYDDAVDYLMFETKSAGYGGSGRSFDWKLLEQYGGSLPYFLSGGLSLGNVTSALELAGRDARLYALDFNSGIELSPGLKNIRTLKEIKQIINSYEIQR